jgi:putative Mg2+ transporter-C (MgtC) family protein
MLEPIGEPRFLVDVLCALLFGSVIGFERQWRRRFAGIRTNALVSVGASLFTIVPRIFPDSGEPNRMAAQVVTGIGFLGAGVILREGLSIRGLDTAATLWCSAAVGTLAGFGLIVEAGTGALVILSVNLFLRPLAKEVSRRLPVAEDYRDNRHFELRVLCPSAREAEIRYLLLHALSTSPLRLKSISSHDIETRDQVELRALLFGALANTPSLDQIVSRISMERDVIEVTWDEAPE